MLQTSIIIIELYQAPEITKKLKKIGTRAWENRYLTAHLSTKVSKTSDQSQWNDQSKTQHIRVTNLKRGKTLRLVFGFLIE